MPYGYLGTQADQTVSNKGVLSVNDALELQSQGKLGGSLELIEEQTVSSVSSVNFTSIKESKYDVHVLQFSNIFASANSDQPVLRFSNDSGSSFETSNYQYGIQINGAHGFFGEGKSTSANAIYYILGRGGSTAIRKNNSYVYLYNLGNASKYSFVTIHTSGTDDAGNFLNLFGGGVYSQAETINAIQFIYTGGANISGDVKLFGVKQI
jgi:hypothetical protein